MAAAIKNPRERYSTAEHLHTRPVVPLGPPRPLRDSELATSTTRSQRTRAWSLLPLPPPLKAPLLHQVSLFKKSVPSGNVEKGNISFVYTLVCVLNKRAGSGSNTIQSVTICFSSALIWKVANLSFIQRSTFINVPVTHS